MPFEAMRMRTANSFAYPYSLPIVNPGAEAGSLSGWTVTAGASWPPASVTANSGGTDTTASLGFSGARFFRMGDGASHSAMKQAIDLPSEAYAEADAGLLSIALSVLVNGFTDTDWGQFRVEFFSGSAGSGVFLGQRTGARRDQSLAVATEAATWTVPKGTRSVVIEVFARRFTGSENSFYFDDVTLNIALSGYTVETIFADRGSDTSGWTVTVGSGQPTTETTWCDFTGWPGLTPGSLAAWQGYKEVNVSSLSTAAQAAIAAGAATMFLNRYAWNENDDDKSRTWIECFNGGSVVATNQDGAASAAWATSGADVHIVSDQSVAVPSTTTKFRKNLRFDRVDGTVLDAAVGFLDCYIRW